MSTPDRERTYCPRCRGPRTRTTTWPRKYDDCAACVSNDAERARWRALTWSEFCTWLSGRRVVHEGTAGFDESLVFYETEDGDRYGAGFESTYLDFDDGSRARLTSNVSAPTPDYSDVTPGGPGYVEPPTVMVRETDTVDSKHR